MKMLPLFEASNKEVLYHGSTNDFDKFDMGKVGENLTKYAYGICLTENPDIAKQYVTGKHCYIYKVKAYNVSSYAGWDETIDDRPDLVNTIRRKLKKAGKTDDVEQLDSEYQDGTVGQLYEWLASLLGSKKEASEWFNIAGINGVICDDSHLGEVYIAFDDSEVRIIGKLGEEED